MSSQTLQKLQKQHPLQALKKFIPEEQSTQNHFFNQVKQGNQSKEQQCLNERLTVCTGELKDEIERFDDLCNPGMISAAYCDECEKVMESYQS